MSYRHALNYLASKTSVIELCDKSGGRAAVSPDWNGRILTSTCNGLDGESFGCVNIKAVEEDSYEDFGGEDIWTLSPLMISFNVVSVTENEIALQQTIRTLDAGGVPAEWDLFRSVSLLNRQETGNVFGSAVTAALKQNDVSAVGFRSENTVRSAAAAAAAARLRGMFNAGRHSAVIIPVPQDSGTELPPLDVDYFGGSPHGCIRRLPQTLLLKSDGRKRCQVHIPFSAVPVLGAVEFRTGILTLWTFDLPNESDKDLLRFYNHGRAHPGQEEWTEYYEINCFSAAQSLLPAEPLAYRQHILHLTADNQTLAGLIKNIFGIHYDDIAKRMG